MTFSNLMSMAYAHRWASRQQEPTNATPTPFPSLNQMCGDDGGGQGIAAGWFVTIGGGTGQGKSLLAQNMALKAMRHGRRIGFLSLEMTHSQLAARFYAMATDTRVKDLERGRFSRESFGRVWDQICDGQGSQTSPTFVVNEAPISSIEQVLDAAVYMRDEHEIDWLILDYMQLVTTGNEESIYSQVTEVAGKMRVFAQSEQVAVLALSQYNTPTGRDTSQKPSIYSMMGGGTIPNNGDLVLLLDHSRYERDERDTTIARTFLIVGKNRHGDVGEVPIEWSYRTLRVREGLPDEEHLWPKARK